MLVHLLMKATIGCQNIKDQFHCGLVFPNKLSIIHPVNAYCTCPSHTSIPSNLWGEVGEVYCSVCAHSQAIYSTLCRMHLYLLSLPFTQHVLLVYYDCGFTH